MRLAPALLFTALTATSVQAADYLRGSISAEAPKSASTTIDWSGAYFGVQAAANNAYINQATLANRVGAVSFPNTGVTTTASNLIAFGRTHDIGIGAGGFIGYNTQWDDVIIGMELDYTRGGVRARSTSPTVSRPISDTGSTTRAWDTTLGAQATTVVNDMTTLKLRVGAAFDRFLPYVSGGVAIGRISSRATSTGSTLYYEVQPILDPVTSAIIGYNTINLWPRVNAAGSIKDDGWRWGYNFGAGVDVALTDNFFLRGGWEYSQFGAGQVRTAINAFKGGAAIKF
ncbi:MAG TPA: outer membrane beta-barrel protein [Beijerinckiaceae bacterium]|nr:outer membrane beta-barrel protein [Beijerinckiaceae bacterium]